MGKQVKPIKMVSEASNNLEQKDTKDDIVFKDNKGYINGVTLEMVGEKGPVCATPHILDMSDDLFENLKNSLPEYSYEKIFGKKKEITAENEADDNEEELLDDKLGDINTEEDDIIENMVIPEMIYNEEPEPEIDKRTKKILKSLSSTGAKAHVNKPNGNVKTCSFCNYKNIPPTAKYCPECGRCITSKFCMQCGFKFEGKEKYCPECGNAR